MKNILVATDFSKNAKNAFEIAAKLAKQQKSTLHVFHSFQLQTYYANVPMNMAGDMAGQLRAEATDEMKKFIEDAPAMLKLKTYIGDGIFIEELKSYVDKENIDLVVVGAGGASKLQYSLLGSSANQVIDKLKCLVLVIPPSYEFKNFSKMVYATDLQGDDFTILVKFAEFAKLFDAELTLLHVKSIESVGEEKNITKLIASVRLQTDYPKVHMVQKDYTDVLEGVNQYLTEANPDLFAMAIHDRAFFDKLFHTSLTKKMAHLSHIPFLTCHKERVLAKA